MKVIMTVPDGKMAQVEKLLKTITGVEIVKVKDMCSIEELLNRCKQQSLDYVASINDYATEEWRPYIDVVWSSVLADKVFAERIVMRKKWQLNSYFLTTLVFYLQTLGVYCSTVRQLELHLRLERTTEQTSIYRNYYRYPISKEERIRLRGIIEKIPSNLR